MFEAHDQTIADILTESRLAGAAQLAAARDEAAASARSLADTACASGLVPRAALLGAVATRLCTRFVADLPARLPPETCALVDARLARAYGIVPLAEEAGVLTVLAEDPLDPRLPGDAAFSLGRPVRLAVADPGEVGALLRRHYGDHEPPPGDAAAGGEDGLSEKELEQLAGREPIVRYVNLVLAQAVRDRASDVHFEPFEEGFRIRTRVDGALRELSPPPREYALPVISRLKVLANLDIAERRLPQDGRIRLDLAGRAVDLRVSTLPTRTGESVVLRVLDQAAARLDLAQLGMPAGDEQALRGLIQRPNGILLVTGPTGSGKTTTLYSCLKLLNSPGVKILTVEDPVEYEIDGVMQVAVNGAAGLTFAGALRSFLRHDPDIVMVGEIRDLETAQIAIQAALTGHLVLATLHTNDAPGAITRLLDLGVEPFLLAGTVGAVLAQRLVRGICPACRASRPAGADEQRQLGLGSDATVFQGPGCDACGHTGFGGRIGIFELLQPDEGFRDLIVAGASLDRLRQHAVAGGMVPLRQSGLRAVGAGLTTLEEISRYT